MRLVVLCLSLSLGFGASAHAQTDCDSLRLDTSKLSSALYFFGDKADAGNRRDAYMRLMRQMNDLAEYCPSPEITYGEIRDYRIEAERLRVIQQAINFEILGQFYGFYRTLTREDTKISDIMGDVYNLHTSAERVGRLRMEFDKQAPKLHRFWVLWL